MFEQIAQLLESSLSHLQPPLFTRHSSTSVQDSDVVYTPLPCQGYHCTITRCFICRKLVPKIARTGKSVQRIAAQLQAIMSSSRTFIKICENRSNNFWKTLNNDVIIPISQKEPAKVGWQLQVFVLTQGAPF